ncbi:uncharacterized protein LOC119836128 [Zerene cesonia]|uniref:uncharacterized protein LOC119836128 n=1 Tax=Zerene cesonia TaxID=33412 RepID=UPI0018E533D4|nr:uncharacterized protein LOC119836128 [Zerene cesonia]
MLLKSFAAVLLLGLVYGAPTSDDEHLTITSEYYAESLVVYKGNHDIVSILVPLNSLNFDEDESSESDESESEITVFFAEADIDENGKRVDQGLYVLKNGKAKKILENGRDAAASGDSSKTVYLAASDGIYVYNQEDNTAVKYGSVSDSIIGIAQEVESDVLYILTEDNTVYKVTDNGNNKAKIDDIVNAQQIVLDYSNNLYFYTPDKKVHVYTSESVKDIGGLPENPSKITLVKPPILLDSGIPVVVDTASYIIYENGTTEDYGIDFESNTVPTAYGMEAALIQYYAHNKKIYEYNILAMVLGSILDELKSFLNDKTENIQNIATQKRKDLRKKE